jgi:hypothetical protein
MVKFSKRFDLNFFFVEFPGDFRFKNYKKEFQLHSTLSVPRLLVENDLIDTTFDEH